MKEFFAPVEVNEYTGNNLSKTKVLGAEIVTSLVDFVFWFVYYELGKLNILGINNETIYPGIDGTCKHINWLNQIE